MKVFLVVTTDYDHHQVHAAFLDMDKAVATAATMKRYGRDGSDGRVEVESYEILDVPILHPKAVCYSIEMRHDGHVNHANRDVTWPCDEIQNDDREEYASFDEQYGTAWAVSYISAATAKARAKELVKEIKTKFYSCCVCDPCTTERERVLLEKNAIEWRQKEAGVGYPMASAERPTKDISWDDLGQEFAKLDPQPDVIPAISEHDRLQQHADWLPRN